MTKLEEKLIELGYEYVKRKDLWIKYKDYPIEITIMYDLFIEKWDGWLSFNNFAIKRRECLKKCINDIESLYEELQRDLEVLREYDNQ